MADREQSNAVAEGPRAPEPFVNPQAPVAIGAVALLAQWVGSVQKRWAEWDTARAEAMSATRRTR